MKVRIHDKNATVIYAAIQFLYFGVLALVFCYASAYLLNRGYSSGQIGMILGLVNIISVFLQPGLASFVKKSGILLGNVMAALFTVISLCAAALLLLPLKGIAFVAVVVILFALVSAMQPSVNSLYRGYHNQGIEINFGFARGIGSAAFSLSSLGAGLLLRKFTPDAIPAMYLVPAVLIIGVLLVFHAPNVAEETKNEVTPKQKALLLGQYPHFYLFLAGIVCLAVTHTFTETYLLQIIQRIGGTSSNIGTAVAISAITELPAMMLYKSASKKVGNRKLLCFAGWMWATKNFLIMIAPSIYLVYASELLQFVSYAIYVPAAVRYIAHAIPESEFLKGQALAGSAFTVGSLISSFGGGQMIDRLGINTTLWIVQVFSVTGVVLFTIATLDSLRKYPTEK